ncbi:NirD/YgiW/YdeI family stress tolerance protein [uncultured Aggregatibacter sp.]|uniref:YgiW/YdeI family stress tolerance OB fold protein n=1 Tax=uncultured Aggregatibacter sp. TaxID=470564 RepID=UPI0025E4BF87|nr:NirD/YgiW/YdeI family stress tolerance protein [uncultured Aggregatibacter sp.]
MKHAITLTTLLMVSSDLFAGFRNVNELDSRLVTVQAVKSMEAHSVVALEGRLVRQIDDDEFIFRDATGEIKVGVGDYAWNGINITPNDRVRIEGAVDKGFIMPTTIDVYQIRKIQ